MKRPLLAIVLALSVIAPLFVPPAAFAGTTGTLSGRVTDNATGAPLSGAKVTVAAPSGTSTSRTDAKGAFSFLTLLPDTYTLVVEFAGYDTLVQRGVTIQADQTQSLGVRVEKSLSTIGRTTSRSSQDLIRSGTTSDVYSINESTAKAVAGVTGAGGINQAYSALSTVPGVQIQQGQQGFYQLMYIRGGDQDQIGYEIDGIPANRPYDNSPAEVLSSFGQQELQVYTGGVPASADAQGISGYVNQVIKTGTYPGFGTLDLGIGSPTFYNKEAFEFGGSTPNRNFTYYVMNANVGQSFRYGNQYNGTGIPGYYTPSFGGPDLPGVIQWGAALIGDHETVGNFHLYLPHKSGLKDDLQLLYLQSLLATQLQSSVNDLGGAASVAGLNGGPLTYTDTYLYSGALGQPINPSAVTQSLFPYTDNNRSFQSVLPAELRDSYINSTDIVKLQYQHAINDKSYLRIMGYSTNATWDNTYPVNYPAGLAFTFIIPTHSTGVQFTYANQFDEHNLLTITGSNLGSRESRIGSTGDYLDCSNCDVTVGSYIDKSGNCYSSSTGLYNSCFSGNSIATLNQATGQISGVGTAPAGSLAALNGAQWIATETGISANYNQVRNDFASASISDQWKPLDKLTINAGMRFENYEYGLVNEGSGYPTRAFWNSAYNREYCFAQGMLSPEAGTVNPNTGISTCPAGTSPVDFSLTNPLSQQHSVWEPRFGLTYQLNADSVIRGSAGIYARPPPAFALEYGTYQQDISQYLGSKFYTYGFTSPEHTLVPDTSLTYDLSLEQHIPHTGLSFKLSPYFRRTQNQLQYFFLNPVTFYESALNVGTQQSEGFEFALQNSSFEREGLSFRLGFTGNRSRIRYNNFATGGSPITSMDTYIKQYNAYTSACAAGKAPASQCGSTATGVAAAPCYTPAAGCGTGTPDFTCAAGSIANPYWNAPAQALLDPSGAYSPYDILPGPYSASNGYEVPYSGTLIVNYKRKRLNITPALAYTTGNKYGNPLSTPGYDPSTCSGVLAGAAHAADTSTCPTGSAIIIPNNFTGQFDDLGAFLNPSRLTLSMQIGYDVNPRVRATLNLTGLMDQCYQRGYVWDNPAVCNYAAQPFNSQPAGNFSSVTDPNLKYPYVVQQGNSNTTFSGLKTPFQFFFDLQFKF